jgi:hypothetical protein
MLQPSITGETSGPEDRNIHNVERQMGRLSATTGCLGLVVTIVWTLQALPYEVSTALCAWALASLPIGILVGHCALSED